MPPAPSAAPKDRLLAALSGLLGRSMGGGRPHASPAPIGRPGASAFGLLAIYALMLAAAETAEWAGGMSTPHQLLGMLVWAGFYGAVRAYLGQRATARVMATVERDIVPHASPAYLDAVASAIEQRQTAVRRLAVPLLVAAAATAVTLWVLVMEPWTHWREPNIQDFLHSPVWLFGAIVYFLSFFVSARSIGAARFHLSFARCLQADRDHCLYVLGAAESPLVKGLAKLGGQILAFWTMVFLSVLSVMILALKRLGDYGLGPNSVFLVVLIPALGFLTLGIGSLVYLESEGKIRGMLKRFTFSQAWILQSRSNALLDPLAGRVPADPGEISQLTDWHDRILAGGRYGSRAGTTISIVLPFLLPAVSLIKFLADSLFAKAG